MCSAFRSEHLEVCLVRPCDTGSTSSPELGPPKAQRITTSQCNVALLFRARALSPNHFRVAIAIEGESRSHKQSEDARCRDQGGKASGARCIKEDIPPPNLPDYPTEL